MGEVVQFPDKSEKPVEQIPAGIPENAVGVGGTVPPAQPQPPLQLKFVPVHLIGVFKSGVSAEAKSVMQELILKVPEALEGYEAEAALQTSHALRQVGGLVVKNSQESYSFYPVDLFERFAIEFQPVSGTTLA